MDLQSALLAIKPAITVPAPVKAPVKAKAKPKQKLPRVVAIDSFEFGRKPAIYGTKEKHSESRPPPEHEYFPERHFGGPLFTNTQTYYPFIIGKTK